MIWIIGLGGALGAGARYLLGNMINRGIHMLHPFPVGTWIINITGSFLLGIIAHFYLTNQISDWLWYFSGVGFCGAYTTFSTFGNETINLILTKKIKLAAIYVLTSILIGFISAAIGLVILK
ncbi:fluoride efflux transporter CrcB [Oceanobacillus rekensis]|uniref:fluoride efflux transporter CrcB n=1 Tax=Oceanobacillus rekensis TaxID=937927 RepID=UPI000B435EAD|nr:fluoride efflux transporter CrcB [Oceanobacillus rekensis]